MLFIAHVKAEIKYAPVAKLAYAIDLGSVTTVEFSPAAVGQVKKDRKSNMRVWRNWQTHQILAALL